MFCFGHDLFEKFLSSPMCSLRDSQPAGRDDDRRSPSVDQRFQPLIDQCARKAISVTTSADAPTEEPVWTFEHDIAEDTRMEIDRSRQSFCCCMLILKRRVGP